jgi:hypothetical protein
MPEDKNNDERWNELNQKLLNAIQKNDLHEMHAIYYDQAMLLKEEGRDSFPVLEQSLKSGLYKEENFDQVQIQVGVNSCDTCKSLSNKVYTVEEAVQTSPLPVSGCSNESCRCIYVPIWSEPPPEIQ